jgi:hypothetical protein
VCSDKVSEEGRGIREIKSRGLWRQGEEAVSPQGGGRGLNKKEMAERLMEARRAEARAPRARPTQ